MAHNSSLLKSGIACYDFAYHDCDIHELHDHQYMTTHGLMTKLARRSQDKKSQLTYLLSAPTLTLLQCHFTKETISSLLSQPHTRIVLLVPMKLICHPTTLNLQRLPRAVGSSIQVVPYDPESSKNCKVTGCITKFCKVKNIDGFMSFDEDVEARMRLAAIVKQVNEMHHHG